MPRLKRRADFLAAAKGVRVHRPTLTLQATTRHLPVTEGMRPRVGFTVTKKVGNAVVRNRIKRRFRAASDGLEAEFAPSTDYVIVARRDALTAPFDALTGELAGALRAARLKLSRSAAPSSTAGTGAEAPAVDRGAVASPVQKGATAPQSKSGATAPAVQSEATAPAVQKRA